jgi:hypothetical protein
VHFLTHLLAAAAVKSGKHVIVSSTKLGQQQSNPGNNVQKT